MIRDILIATHNPDKLKELEDLLNPLQFRLHFLHELPDFFLQRKIRRPCKKMQ